MSIKGFHLIFITIAAIFCGALGVWAVFLDDRSSGPGMTIFGVIAMIAAVGLTFYAFYFRRKSKDIIV